jgi:branched-chain amino acid transport system permease protein
MGAIGVSWLQLFLGGIVPSATPMIVGAILIAMVLLLPRGIVPTAQASLRRILPAPAVRLSTETAPLALPGEPLRLMAVGLSKRFSGLQAVDGVSLSFEPRRTYCIIGPNGAGKSTFFHLLTGRYSPTSGTITYGEDGITQLPPHERVRRGMGIKLQVPAIYRELSVAENLWLAAFARVRDIKQADGIVRSLLDRIGLTDRAGLKAGELAHGEQQWLEIGMVMARSPQVILLDEPTAGMTREETLRTVELIKEISRSATAIVVEHDMEFVSRLDAPIVVLHQGRVFAQGTYAEVRSTPEVLDIYLGREAYAASP